MSVRGKKVFPGKNQRGGDRIVKFDMTCFKGNKDVCMIISTTESLLVIEGESSVFIECLWDAVTQVRQSSCIKPSL